MNKTDNESVTVFTDSADKSAVFWETQAIRRWKGLRARYYRSRGTLEFEFTTAIGMHRIALIDMLRNNGEAVVEGLPPVRSKELREKLFFAPAGFEFSGWSHVTKPTTVIIVELEPSEYRPLTGAQPFVRSAEPMLRSILQQFRTVLIDEPECDPSYIQALAGMLCWELDRVARRPNDPATFGLTALQLRRAIAYIDDRLEGGFSIDELASQMRMSRFHFSRMFKRSTGMPPHRFGVVRRVEKAKELLQSGDVSVAEVADKAGFTSPTQMTRMFRKITGLNPSDFRKRQS